MTPSTSNKFVPRVAQLDSKYLDDEVISLLDNTLSNAFKYSCQNAFIKYEPELKAFIHSFIYYFTAAKRKQTIGQELLQIKFENSIPPQNIYLHLTAHIFGAWIKQRTSLLTSYIKNEQLKDSFVKCLRAFETSYQLAEFLNLILFLINGKYPTITERLFKLNVILSHPDMKQKLCYNYFTRELLWNGFADLLTFILPLISINKFHQFICKFLPSAIMASKPGVTKSQDIDTASEFECICIICNCHAILPQTFGCKHVACYYCIHSTLATTASFLCSVCGKKIDNFTPIMPLSKKMPLVN